MTRTGIKLDCIPQELKERKQWCKWTYSKDNNKIPLQPDGKPFRSNDSTTWCGFENVQSLDKIAFTISEDDCYTGVDLDGCIDNGQWTDWSIEILDRFKGFSYAEVSPSGTGVKLLTRATKPSNARCVHNFQTGRKEQIECYGHSRFWTITGNVLEGFETIGDGQAAIDWLCSKFLGRSESKPYQHDVAGFGLVGRGQSYVDSVSGVGEGGRNNEAFKLAGHLFAITDDAGGKLSDGEVLMLVSRWNQRNSPPLDERELQSAVRSAKTNGTPREAKNPKPSDRTSKNIGKSEVSALAPSDRTPKQSIPDLMEFRPFPTHCLPKPLGEYIRQVSLAVCCDESFVALPLLSGLAASVGNSLNLKIKRTWKVPPILWCAVVAPSGSAKSVPPKQALRPIYNRQNKLVKQFDKDFAEYQQQHEVYQKQLAEFKKSKNLSEFPPEPPVEPTCPRIVVSDTTIEALGKRLSDNPRGVLALYDELAGWLGAFNRYSKGSGDEAKWLEFYSAQTAIIDRSTAKRPLIVDRANVSLFGTIQPGILRKHLTADYKASGLAARLLFSMPPRTQKRWSEHEVEETLEDELTEIFEKLLAIEMQRTEGDELLPGLVNLDRYAKDLFVQYYDRHNKEQQALDDDLYAAFSKLEEVAARIALIVHAVRYVIGEVASLYTMDIGSMSAGIELCEWFKNEAKRVYSVLAEDQLAHENRQLIQWIASQDSPVTPRDFYRGNKSKLASTEEAERMLQSFAEAELGKWIQCAPEEHGGRPTRRFELNASARTSVFPMKQGGFGTEVEEVSANGVPWQS